MIRVALVGVGNNASALVQGVQYYTESEEIRAGLMSEIVGGFGVESIVFSAAFDVNETKVGLDLSEAIFAEPNNTRRFADVPYLDITVLAGPVLDGVGKTASRVIRTTTAEGNVIEHLRATKTDVVVNFLPVGSEDASRFYAGAALSAGCAFVNAIPARIARELEWQARYLAAGLPLIGDDVKSQVGATIIHRALTSLFSIRGVALDRTYQLNVGGNMDFLNMLDGDRLDSKRESKRSAVTRVANRGDGLDDDDVHIGPSDYVPWLGDEKLAFIRLEGSAFGGAPLEVELRLKVWDSPNSAGVVIDAIRYAGRALLEGRSGSLAYESAWLMKAPPEEIDEETALAALSASNAAHEEERVSGRESASVALDALREPQRGSDGV